MAARASNPPIDVFIEPEWLDGAKPEEEVVARAQKEHPLNEIISVSWGE